MSALVLQSEAAFQVVKYAGAGYLLYLAWKAWRSGDAAAAQAPRPPADLGRIFVEGLLTNLLNPKMALSSWRSCRCSSTRRAAAWPDRSRSSCCCFNIGGTLVNI